MENTKNNPDSEYENFIKDAKDNNVIEMKHECEGLLRTSGYDDDWKARIENELWYYSEEELNELKSNLYMNQVDRIDQGMNYNQTDIKRKLK